MSGAAANASWYAPLATVAAVPITADPAVPGRGDRPPDGGQHDLDDRHVVPLPGVAQAGRAGRVAGDHQQLDPARDEVVEHGQGVPADLRDR
jgi:hypothetical protein